MQSWWRVSALGVCCVVGFSAIASAVEPIACKCPMGRDYFLFAPQQPDAGKTYFLVVGRMGSRGREKT